MTADTGARSSPSATRVRGAGSTSHTPTRRCHPPQAGFHDDMVRVVEAGRGEAVWLAVVADEIRQTLSSTCLPAAYGDAVVDVLSAPSGILSDLPNTHWTHTVITCCTAAGGRWEPAVTAVETVPPWTKMMGLGLTTQDFSPTS